MHSHTVWQRGHELVVHAWAELAWEANVLVYTREGLLQQPVHTWTDQRGDIKFNLSCQDVMGAVCNVSITHVALSSGPRQEEWGTFKHHSLAASEHMGSKNSMYYSPFHREQNLKFLALVGTTRGVLSAVGVTMYHHLAHLATEAAFKARGWLTSREKGKGYTAFFQCRLSQCSGKFNKVLEEGGFICLKYRIAFSEIVQHPVPTYRFTCSHWYDPDDHQELCIIEQAWARLVLMQQQAVSLLEFIAMCYRVRNKGRKRGSDAELWGHLARD
eukprot:3665510-Rhodomonas_salina.1